MTTDGGHILISSRVTGGSQLLRAKLRVPTQPAHFVPRPRLDELLDELVTGPVTLVVAPAGAGKTALVAGWVDASSLACAWLSLDESDRDARQLWRGVIAALDALVPGCGVDALDLLRRSCPVGDVVGQLLNDLDGAAQESHVLVVDDLHLVDDIEEVATSLALFHQHLPPWLHVVALSRREPALPVDRLRARGQLGEVRFAELRFSSDEASELLARLAPSLSEAEIEDAAEGIDGWAAGLQMVALAARSSRAQLDAGAALATRALLLDDFVWHEILALESAGPRGAPPRHRRRRPCERQPGDRPRRPVRCRRAAGPSRGEGSLPRPPGHQRVVRVALLIRTALLAELARRSPARITDQHARAARWFEQEGEVAAALEHWLLAQRMRDALRLLAVRHADLYDAGRESIIQRTIDSIPPGVTASDFDAMVDYAWCQLLVSRQGFKDAVEHAARWAKQGSLDDQQRSRLCMLEAIVSVVHVDWAESARLARSALAQFGERWRVDPIGRFGWNLLARAAALGERWDDDADEVRAAREALDRDPERRLSFEGTRAVGLALAGRPIDALQAVAGIRHAAAVTNMTILRDELAIAEATAHWELGDHHRAVDELRALADATETMLYVKLLALLALVDAQVDAGEVEAARRTFEQATELEQSGSVGPGGHGWVARAGVVVALAAGNIDAARRWAGEQDDPFWRAIGEARIHLVCGDRRAAGGALAGAEPRCPRHEVVLRLVRAGALEDAGEAGKCVIAALETAAANEMLQTVASDAPDVLDHLEREAWRAPEAWLDRLRRVLAASGRRVAARHVELMEPLTDRERDVLRFLPSRLTTREIADELYVSVNTLKFHLKVIYRKLGVTSRAEAAAKARRMSPN